VTLIAGVHALQAATILELVPTAPHQYQQTTNNPCIFGDTSCQNGAFPQSPDITNAGPYSSTMTYDASVLRALVGNLFFIAIDGNQTNDAQTLNAFSVVFAQNGNTYSFTGPTLFPVQANGNGYADYLLTGPAMQPIDLTGITGNVTFSVNATLNDGPDQFLIVNAGTVTTQATPEPTSVALLASGLGLITLGVSRRRIRR